MQHRRPFPITQLERENVVDLAKAPSKWSISAVVPAHNRADCIARCLDSIASQTRPVDEIIVVDDASHDDTVDEVRRWQSKHDIPLRLICHRENLGGSSARNTAIKAARNTWIAFLDSDDLWHPSKLERQMRALEDAGKGTALIYAGLRHFDGEGRTTYTNVPTAQGDMSERLYGENLLCSVSSVVARKDLLERAGGFDESLPACQDWELLIRLARLTRFAVVPDILVDYDASERDRITRQQRAGFRGHWTILERYTRPQGDAAAIARLYYTIGDILMVMNRPRAAFRFFFASWRHQPLSIKRTVALCLSKARISPRGYSSVKRLAFAMRR